MDPTTKKASILDAPLKRWFPANLETLLVVLLLLAAVVSRFYNLGAMTITFDEVNHVTPSDSLYLGKGYQYDPMSHGPLQFHMIGLSYALFGDNDFTTRIPAALLSVTTIVLALFAFKRYLGRTGALIAGFLFLISPYMLFYGRYARNEAYIVVWGLLTLYAMLRYLERGEAWVLFLFTAANAIHFTDKTTSYMYAGQEFLFLAAYFVERISRREWPLANRRKSFFLGLILAVILVGAAAGIYLTQKPLTGPGLKIGLGALVAGGLGSLVWSGVQVVKSFGWQDIRSDRSLAMLMLLGTFILPLLSAIPIIALGQKAVDYSTAGIMRVVLVAGFLVAVATVLGLAWFGRKWLLHAAVFFVPFILLYSTFFTNPRGLMDGVVGALSYWLDANATNRVYQPYFYYAFIEIPMYEFLPALGTLAAVVIAFVKKLWQSKSGEPFTPAASAPEVDAAHQPVPYAALLIYWSATSLFIFSIAGEKAPWLTVHIALPLILAAAWSLGWLVETIPWGRLAAWTRRNYVRATALVFFGVLAFITGRSAYRAAYINYDYPLEYLVYAHHSPYPKVVFNEIEELSQRITGGTDLVVAYDNNVRYPYWWYMRHYPNIIDYDKNPTREVRNALVIVGSDENNAKLNSVVQNNYFVFKYPRIWWQNMDYWNLDWKNISSEREADLAARYTGASVPPMTVFDYIKYVWPHIQPFFTDARVRYAVWQIWFNRDFTAWAALKNSSGFSLTDWAGAQYMYEYIRKDIASQLWPLGAPAQPPVQPVDPYEGITSPVTPDRVLGSSGSEAGQFFSPRQVALAADGSLYVADSLNHRIQHIAPDGQVLQVWGTFADISQGPAPAGTFNEPWGVAVGPDGSVYVADTWNYRIQKFTSEGEFIKMWGTGPGIGPEEFYGPRGLAVDGQGRVFVADTGNKRIVIYDGEGNYLGEFGGPGMELGQMDEPVDLAIDGQGRVYVTDTWNQRVEVFEPVGNGLEYMAVAQWPVEGWYGNSPENKPFVAVDGLGNVFVTDPEQCRVIEFDSGSGQAERVWEGCTTGGYELPSGIVSDGAGGIWLSDARNGTIVHFEAKLSNP
jgi:uncharacterized protein (TIGR03663 family)